MDQANKFICEECKGTRGHYKVKYQEFEMDGKLVETHYQIVYCLHCLGRGYFDWIDNITKKPRRFYGYD